MEDMRWIYYVYRKKVGSRERSAWSAQSVLEMQADQRTGRIMDLLLYLTGHGLLTHI